MTATDGVAAVQRALSILDAFRGTNGVLTLKAISESTGLYKSTILRLMVSLEAFGYIRRLEEGGYQVGPKFSELAAVYQASFNLGDYVLPVLRNLVAQVNESASFYVAERDVRLCLYRVETDQVIRDHIRVGDTLPLDKGASGRVLMRFADGLPAALAPEEFVATSTGERHPDMAAVAAPVFALGGRIAGALSISGPRSRFSAKLVKSLREAVRVSAIELSRQLGAPQGPFDALRQ